MKYLIFENGHTPSYDEQMNTEEEIMFIAPSHPIKCGHSQHVTNVLILV